MLDFENSEYLIGLLLLAPLVWLLLRTLKWKRQISAKLGSSSMLEALIPGYRINQEKSRTYVILLALALAVFSLANLRSPSRHGKGVKGNGIDVMVALDVSKSMLSEDEKPSRLDKAKHLIASLAQGLDNDRVGLIVFAGEPELQMPLTDDPSAIKMFLENASPDLVPVQGTNIRDALRASSIGMNTHERKCKAVVLITDGEDHEDEAVGAAKDLSQTGATIYTVGIGSSDGSPIMDPETGSYKKDSHGNVIISKLNESLLKQIASVGGGQYFHLTGHAPVEQELISAMSKLQTYPIAASGRPDYRSYYSITLFIAVMLLLAEALIPDRRWNLKWALKR